jgi:hypothetical protein
VCATITRASQRACCTVACSARSPPSAVSFPQHRRHHHRPQSADNPQASAMRHSNSRRSSPAVYSTTSIPACPIPRPGRPSLRGTEHHRISPPNRMSYTDAYPRGALGAPSSSSLRTALASCTTAHPALRWPRTGRAVLLRRQPRRRRRRARIWRCGCCVMRLVVMTSCLSRRWSRLIWTHRGWTTRRSSSKRYRKHISFFSCLTQIFFDSRYRHRRHRIAVYVFFIISLVGL